MRILLLFGILLVLCLRPLMAQKMINNKLSVYMTCGIAIPAGDETVTKESYSAPSLMNNFQYGTSYSFSLEYTLKKNILIQLGIGNMTFRHWSYTGEGSELEENADRYDGAEFSLLSIYPAIGLKTPFKKNGIWNCISLAAMAGPSIGFGNADFSKAAFSSPTPIDFTESRFISAGISINVNAKYNLSNRVSLGVSGSAQYDWVSSYLFDDDAMLFVRLQGGVVFKFMYNKRYKYEGE